MSTAFYFGESRMGERINSITGSRSIMDGSLTIETFLIYIDSICSCYTFRLILYWSRYLNGSFSYFNEWATVYLVTSHFDNIITFSFYRGDWGSASSIKFKKCDVPSRLPASAGWCVWTSNTITPIRMVRHMQLCDKGHVPGPKVDRVCTKIHRCRYVTISK